MINNNRNKVTNESVIIVVLLFLIANEFKL